MVKTSDLVHLCNKQSPLAQSKLIKSRNAYQLNVTLVTASRLFWNAIAVLYGANTLRRDNGLYFIRVMLLYLV